MVFTGIDGGMVQVAYCRRWGWDDEKVVADVVDVHLHRPSLFETKDDDDDDDDVEESDRQHVVATSCF